MFEKPTIKKFVEGKEKELSPEEMKYIIERSEKVVMEEFEIGEGNYSFVYEDIYTDSCLKVTVKEDLNNIHEEAKFLSKLTGLRDDVIVPEPQFSFEADIPQKGKSPIKRRILCMEKIDGPDFRKVLTGEEKLPDTFNYDTFFGSLEKFFEEMHSDKVGVYHRDIADRNIMIDRVTGKPAVIDFGRAVYKSYYSTDEIREEKQYEGGPHDLKKLKELKEEVRNYLTRVKK